tara:strand:- start:74 stop:556 length:483 start_codon:yes stop_codon:yes gene_type:complete
MKKENKYLYYDLCNTIEPEVICNEIMTNKDILTPDLLKGQWKNRVNEIHTTGHCYAAAEALYYLCGHSNVYNPRVCKEENGDTHWFIQNKFTNEILDPTKTQYTELGEEPPYHLARGTGFMQQSTRCVEIMKRTLKAFGLSPEVLKELQKENKRNRKRKI